MTTRHTSRPRSNRGRPSHQHTTRKATTVSLTVHDAAGRPVTAGDTIGATTSGNRPTTLVGPVLRVSPFRVRVLVTNRPTTDPDRPRNGDEVLISTSRVLIVEEAHRQTFKGFRTPDGRTWTRAAHTDITLYEAPMVPARYEAAELRDMYDGSLEPVWDAPADGLDELVPAAELREERHARGRLRTALESAKRRAKRRLPHEREGLIFHLERRNRHLEHLVNLANEAARVTAEAGQEAAAEAHGLRERVGHLQDRVRTLETALAGQAPPCGRELSTGQPCPDHPRTDPSPVEPASPVAEALDEAAHHIATLPQDYELDPGRGEAVDILRSRAATARRTGN